MRATYKRKRRADPLASPDAIRSVFNQLRASLPDIIPSRDKELIRMLHSARHIQRYSATDTKRGRPSRWKRVDLIKVATQLSQIIERETSSRLSIASFIDHYLRLLNFPSDVIDALNSGEINLSEAAQLARITPERISSTPRQAKQTRSALLSTHLQTKESSNRLRLRVAELLYPPADESRNSTDNSLDMDLEDFDPYDPTHLFWDQIKQLGFALREIRREDLTDEEIDELLRVTEPVLTVLARIQRRKERSSAKKLGI